MADCYESRATTHADDCWSWGPAHYGCAVREIERLREQLRLATVDQAIAEAEANDVRRNAGVHVPGAGQPAAPDVEAMVEALEAALMVMTSKEVRLEKQADAITMVRSQLARLRDAVHAAQAPRACTCHPDDRPDGHCRERYAASECQALAAQAQAANADALNAARYRWLRDREIPDWLNLWHQNPDRIDAAIDAAMEGENERD